MPALLSVLCLTVPGPVWQWEGRERMFPECLRVPSTVQGAHVLSHLMLTLSTAPGPETEGTGLVGVKLASPPSVPALGGGAGTHLTLPCSCLGQVSEMQRLDAQVKELVLKAAVEAERLVAGKLKKDTYIENEKLISGKRQDLVGKIDHILDAL